jgi:hypothetical protein
MAWNKQQFRDAVYDWFSSQRAENEAATAAFIGSEYHKASAATVPVQFAALPAGLKGPGLVSAGFLTSFLSCRASDEDDTVDNWKPAALGIITYWTAVPFALTPPPPGGLTGITNLVINPGTVNPLAEDIFTAFSSDTPEDCADKLTLAMTNHLETVKGLWSGTAPGSPPPPFAFPWTSLK